MNTRAAIKYRVLFTLLLLCIYLSTLTESSWRSASAQEILTVTPGAAPILDQTPFREVINPYFSIEHRILPDGTSIDGYVINGPPTPPVEFEAERAASIQSTDAAVTLPNFPSYSWVFGCSAVSGAMIAGYYDRGSYPSMYTGPTNGGVMPLTDTSWATWSDGHAENPYPNNPLVASHNGVDGRTKLGSIDDYWVEFGSSTADPYIGNWTQHTWGTAIGDFMKTSQSAYENEDGSTVFWNWSNNTKMTCSTLETSYPKDGTHGRKLFYQARGYTVTDCYNQKTDNQVPGGFSLANFQAEIDAGHPVMLNLAGHTIVGYGYDGATIYIRDTWHNTPDVHYTMTWGGSYSGMALQSVSIVHLAPQEPPDNWLYLPLLVKNLTSPRSPTDIQLSNSSIAESQSINSVVGTLSSVDPNVGDTFTYSLVSGAGDTGNASFDISGSQLRSSAIFDYETTNSYSIRIRTTDQTGLFFEKVFTITITDVSETSIANGDFEQGAVAWTEYSTNEYELILHESETPQPAHNGEWLAWLGSDDNETSRLSQTFYVPAEMSYLHYWYWIGSEDFCSYDFFRIKVNAVTLHTQDLCDNTITYSWVEGSINLAAYADTTITLMFEVTTDDSFPSGLLLDDVSLSGAASVSPPEILPSSLEINWVGLQK